MENALYYMCSFTLGNFTYLYRCRIADQYCCGHTCCFKQPNSDEPHLFSSWYFWSLILVVLIVFGCIIVSFALSTIKRRVDIHSWSAFAGSAFHNLATTVTGKQGIIVPQLHYQAKKANGSPAVSTVSASLEPSDQTRSDGHSQKTESSPPTNTLSTANESSKWIEIQLSPLHPAYQSSWTGSVTEQRIAASTQVFFPPGFINS